MGTMSALVVMARYPEIGAVKTRLACSVGAEGACTLYRAFLHDIDHRFRTGSRKLIWYFDPPDADFATVLAHEACCRPQRGAALGARMGNCFAELRREGFGPVTMIGADVPHVHDEWLDEAEARLRNADVVLGPARDGGYYLIAMNRPHDVFSGIEMSTPRVLADTVRRAQGANLRVHLLPASFDVDDAADLAALCALLSRPGWPERLPHTAAVLASWERQR